MEAVLLNPTKPFFSQSNYTQTLSLLERCSNMEELKQIHGHMLKTGLAADIVQVSRVVTFCVSSKSGSLEYAQMVFDRIPEPNTFVYNVMVRGYSNSTEPEKAIFMYQQMLHSSVPHNSYTFPFLLKACSCLSETEQIHAHVLKFGFGSNVYAINALIHAYAKSGNLEPARLLFDNLPERDVVTWNSMIDGYTRCSQMDVAYAIFKEMEAKNVISWTTMICGYVRAGMHKEALNLFREMQSEGVEPDKVALASTLSACAQLGALDQGRWIHAYVDKLRIEVDPVLGCVLIDMYAKCGDLEEALGVFRRLKKKEVTVWTALISGYAVHGHGIEALKWFAQMQKAGIKPNNVTFTAILTACSHAGLVEEGKALFASIERIHKLNPTIEHYGCMVDLLGRAGYLKEAKQLIKDMPVKPNAVIWGALLNACWMHKDVELGKSVGKILIEEDPYHGGRYIHLASILAAGEEWDLAVETRRKMKKQGVSKLPGCSSISLNGTIHEFLAGDTSHPQTSEIYHMWDNIAETLKEEEYKPEIVDFLHF